MFERNPIEQAKKYVVLGVFSKKKKIGKRLGGLEMEFQLSFNHYSKTRQKKAFNELECKFQSNLYSLGLQNQKNIFIIKTRGSGQKQTKKQIIIWFCILRLPDDQLKNNSNFTNALFFFYIGTF